jgi:hypothetical protein
VGTRPKGVQFCSSTVKSSTHSVQAKNDVT